MKRFPVSKQLCFATGQLGWSLLFGLVNNWLIYIYQPTKESGLPLFLPQTLLLGFIPVVGLLAGLGRLFDAFVDPAVASFSDRCKRPDGRRIPFLKFASVPFAVFTVLIFAMPLARVSWANALWLFVVLELFYISYSCYVTPFNALIPELGRSQRDRLNISTFISLTFIVGTAVSYLAPTVWNALMAAGLSKIAAVRLTLCLFAVFALLCMLVPVLTIREKEYVEAHAAVQLGAFESLKKTFRNPHFRVFIASDIVYWLALTLFQSGLPYIVTVLLRLGEDMTFPLFAAMTGLSLVFYIPINILARRIGKKKLIVFAFSLFTVTFLLTYFVGVGFPMPLTAQGFLLVAVASLPLAIFGILPQAVLADISQLDVIQTGENREGMFFAARSFTNKAGQMCSLMLFSYFLFFGKDIGNDRGIRLAVLTAGILCFVGMVLFLFFREKAVMRGIAQAGGNTPQA